MADYYTVQSGDSWASIAGKVYGDQRMFAELMKSNGGVSMLRPGMQVYLPQKVSNPFVSNELAAAFGMATSGQVADLYKSSTNPSAGVSAEWMANPNNPLNNMAWASAWARGEADPLVYGRLPDSWTSAHPTGAPAAPANVVASTNGGGTGNPQSSYSSGPGHNFGAAPVSQQYPGSTAAGANPVQKPLATLEEFLPQMTPEQIKAMKAGQDRFVMFQNSRISQQEYLRRLKAQELSLAAYNKANPPMGYSRNVRHYFGRAGGKIERDWGVYTEQPPAQAEAPVAPTATTPVAEPTPAEYLSEIEGLDWFAIRKALEINPPYDYYYPDEGGGGGGGAEVQNPYFGLVNLRLGT